MLGDKKLRTFPTETEVGEELHDNYDCERKCPYIFYNSLGIAYLRLKSEYEKLKLDKEYKCSHFIDFSTESLKKFTNEYRLSRLSLLPLLKIFNEKILIDSLDYYFIEIKYMNCMFVWQLIFDANVTRSKLNEIARYNKNLAIFLECSNYFDFHQVLSNRIKIFNLPEDACWECRIRYNYNQVRNFLWKWSDILQCAKYFVRLSFKDVKLLLSVGIVLDAKLVN